MTGGGAKLVVEQLLRSTKQMIAPTKIESFLISETDSKNCPHLEIRLILGIGRLRESGDRYKPIPAAV